MHDIIILGGGAAGLAAAAYGLNKQLDVVLIAEEIGGKAGTQQRLRGQAGDEEILGTDTVQALAQRVQARAGAVLADRVVRVAKVGEIFEVETQGHGVQEGKAVLVATGAAPLTLNVPGAKKLLNYGIGYSITTHAHMLGGKTVAVIGTTTRALRGAIELATIGANVYLIAPDAASLATPLARTLLRMPQVSAFKGYTIKEIRGTSNIEYLVIAQAGEESMLRVDAAFADVGLLPNSGVVRELAQVDQGGFIKVDANDMTSLPGLFAAGDVTTALAENILVAIGSGTRATMRAYEYLLAHPLINLADSAD